jgi:hypothetical protein
MFYGGFSPNPRRFPVEQFSPVVGIVGLLILRIFQETGENSGVA